MTAHAIFEVLGIVEDLRGFYLVARSGSHIHTFDVSSSRQDFLAKVKVGTKLDVTIQILEDVST